jgi:hypothetical protein
MVFRYAYLVCPVIHPKFKREHIESDYRHKQLPLTRSDLLLTADCMFHLFYLLNFMLFFLIL